MNIRLSQIFNSIKGRSYSLTRKLGRVINTIYEYFKSSNNSVILNSWTVYRFGKVKQRNWGDELNVYLMEELIGTKVIIRDDVFKSRKLNYAVIGSLIPQNIDCETVIWGAGTFYDKCQLPYKPLKVCAVRGKITRKVLIDNGIECPKIYGDPALILPLVYKPTVDKKYRLGLICHINDEKSSVYHEFLKKYPKDILQIKLHDYGDWHSVIDKICSCEVIASSSLHGIIVSDAYGIPNIWLQSLSWIPGGNIKFLDYFSGVNRDPVDPVILEHGQNLQILLDKASGYIPINYDIIPLLKACPFPIKDLL